MKSKTAALLLIICLMPYVFMGCGEAKDLIQQDSASEGLADIPTDMENVSPNKEREFTDSAGRTVRIPAHITRIAATGPMAQIILFALAPEMLVGIATEWDSAAIEYLPEKYHNLPVIGQLYGGKGDMNLEELLKAKPDVVIDIGESKASIREDMDALSEQTNIPFVYIGSSLSGMSDTYRLLGKLVGKEGEAEVLADYCERVYKRAVSIANAVGENEKADLLYCLGDKGINVIAKGSYHSQVLDILSNNLAVIENPSSMGTGNEVDVEQIYNWNPDVIIFAPNSVYDVVGEDPLWQGISAIRSGSYYEVPYGPYNWISYPPSVQRYLGLIWLADLLYPEYVEYDIFEETAEYFRLFYHYELTKDQFLKLTCNSVK